MVNRMMLALDSNKDGKISMEEFTSMHKKRFESLDTNKDGSIDEAERTAVAKKMEEGAKKMREQMQGRMRAMQQGKAGKPGQGRPHGRARRGWPGKPGERKAAPNKPAKPDSGNKDKKSATAVETSTDDETVQTTVNETEVSANTATGEAESAPPVAEESAAELPPPTTQGQRTPASYDEEITALFS
jgi:hypothetical protein